MSALSLDGVPIRGGVTSPVECIFRNLEGYALYINSVTAVSDIDSQCIFDPEAVETFWNGRKDCSLPYFKFFNFSDLIKVERTFKKHFVIGRFVRGSFVVMYDSRPYLRDPDLPCVYVRLMSSKDKKFHKAAVLEPAEGLKMCSLTAPGVGSVPYELETDWDRERTEKLCRRMKKGVRLYFYPVHPDFRQFHGRKKVVCVEMDTFETGQPEILRLVLTAYQRRSTDVPTWRAWPVTPDSPLLLEHRRLLARPVKMDFETELLCQLPAKRFKRDPRAVISYAQASEKHSGLKIWPMRKNNYCCTNDGCQFCGLKAARLESEKKLWSLKDKSRPTCPAFNPFTIANNLELDHRLSTTYFSGFFKDIDLVIKRARDLSVICFDVEAITVSKIDRRRKEGVYGVTQPDLDAGNVTVGCQVPVMIGVSYLKEDFRQVRIPDVGTEVFQIPQTGGDVKSASIKALVKAFFDFVLSFRTERELIKRKMVLPYTEKLKKMSEASETLMLGRTHRGPASSASFESTFLGNMIRQLGELCRESFLVSFHGSRYDLPILDRWLFSVVMDSKTRRNIKIAKSGRCYKIFSLQDVNHVDLRALMGGQSSLDGITKVLGVDKKYKISKGFQPFKLFVNLESLNSHDLPPYHHDCFVNPGTGEKICTREQYDSYQNQLRSWNHRTLLAAYLKQDVLVTLLCFFEAQTSFRNLFRIEVLGIKSHTASGLFFRQASVILPFLSHQPSFSKISPTSTVGLLCHDAVAGGLVCKQCDRIELGDPLFPHPENDSEAGKICRKLATFDFRSLYPHFFLKGKCIPVGEPACYSPLSAGESHGLDDVFKLTSSGGIYDSEHYIMCCLKIVELLERGWTLAGTHASFLHGEICLIPQNPADLTVFARDSRGRSVLYVYQYDGSVHAAPDFPSPQSTLHSPRCSRHVDGYDLESNPSYRDLLNHGRWQERCLKTLYGGYYDRVIYERQDPCAFHSPYILRNKKYRRPASAIRDASLYYPSLNIVFDAFPDKLTPFELLSRVGRREADGSDSADDDSSRYDSGFICLDGHFDPEKSKFFDPRFGLCIGKKKIERSQLSAEFFRDLECRIKLENPGMDPAVLPDKIEEFVLEMCRDEKLVPSHSFRVQTISLDYWAFLTSAGFITDNVHHVVLFALRSQKSAALHAFTRFAARRSLQREELNRRIQRLDRLERESASSVDALDKLTLKTYSSLIKLSLNSIFGRSLFVNRYKQSVRTGSALARAISRNENARRTVWFDNLTDLEPLAVNAGADGVESYYLAKHRRNSPAESPVQLAAGTLQCAKRTMARGYLLLKLLFKDNFRSLYSDTDSFHCALGRESLVECEDPTLPDEEKTKIRRLLFGYPDAETAYSLDPDARSDSVSLQPLSGKLRMELDDVVSCVYPGLKSYMLERRESPPDLKLKSVSRRSAVTREMMSDVVDKLGFIREVREEIRPTHRGIEIVESVKTVGRAKSAVNYKFVTRPGGDVRAFD